MRTFEGKIISTKMKDTAVVEIVWRTPHKLYKKLLTRSKKLKASLNGMAVALGDKVKIQETRKLSKDKYFKIVSIKKEEKK